jgi:hypothetical protein
MDSNIPYYSAMTIHCSNQLERIPVKKRYTGVATVKHTIIEMAEMQCHILSRKKAFMPVKKRYTGTGVVTAKHIII